MKLLKLCPVFSFLLGFCPALAVTTSVDNALGMGAAFTFVLVFSNFFVSILRKVIPSEIRIPLFIIVAVTFVSIVDMIMSGFTPDLYRSLGIFIPLIVVNCIILGRAESFAYKHNWLNSVKDAFINGFGFTFGLALLATIREVLGNGTFMNIRIMPAGYQPVLLFILPPGAFLLIAFILAYLNTSQQKA